MLVGISIKGKKNYKDKKLSFKKVNLLEKIPHPKINLGCHLCCHFWGLYRDFFFLFWKTDDHVQCHSGSGSWSATVQLFFIIFFLYVCNTRISQNNAPSKPEVLQIPLETFDLHLLGRTFKFNHGFETWSNGIIPCRLSCFDPDGILKYSRRSLSHFAFNFIVGPRLTNLRC